MTFNKLAIKAASVFLTLMAATLITFFLIRLIPGDPVTSLLGERGGDPAMVAELKAKLGLDKSIFVQYLAYIRQVFHGDLGVSIISHRPVFSEFWERFVATAELSFFALLWSTLVAVPLGILAATKRDTYIDSTIVGSAVSISSMPIFWWGLLLILFFSVHWGLAPVSGRLDATTDIATHTGFLCIDAFFSDTPLASLKSVFAHLFLPALTLGTYPLAILTRMTRTCVLDVLESDYIRAEKAQGISSRRILWKYALRAALIPLMTIFGILVGTLLTGAVLTESIFSWPGLGRWIVKSVEGRDYPVLQGGIFLLMVVIIFVNTCVDLSYWWIDPRTRKTHS